MKTFVKKYKELIAPSVAIMIALIILFTPGLFEHVSKYLADAVSTKSAWFGGLIATAAWTVKKLLDIRED